MTTWQKATDIEIETQLYLKEHLKNVPEVRVHNIWLELTNKQLN